MIIVLAGTSDARQLALEIQKAGYHVMATVVTEHAAEQLQHAGLSVHLGRLTAAQLTELIQQKKAKAVVDASHPFAEEASKNAMQAAADANVPYIRYERKATPVASEHVTFVDSYEEAAEYAAQKKGVVMLTTGSKTLHIFAKKIARFTGFARHCSHASAQRQYGKMRTTAISARKYCRDARTVYKRIGYRAFQTFWRHAINYERKRQSRVCR